MMKLLTLVWTLAVTLMLCCDGAMIDDPMLQGETVWLNPEIQYSELVDKKSVNPANTESPMTAIQRIEILRQLIQDTNIANNEALKTKTGKRSRYPYFVVPYNRF